MEYKVCTHCKRVLPYSSFTFKDKAHTRLNSWCRDCQKQKTKEIRLSNIEKYKLKDKEKKKEVYKRKRAIINSYKKGGCLVCGEKEYVCLDFHHINPKEKSFEIGHYFHLRGIDYILEEMKKCVVLCANCHRKVHAGLIDLKEYDTNTKEKRLDPQS